MKNLFIPLSLSFLLISCSPTDNPVTEENTAPQTEENVEKNNTKQTTNETSKKYSNSPQAVNDQTVVEVGQTYEDANGIITLKAIHHTPETHEVGPIELTIKDVKVFNYLPSNDLIDYFHGFTHDEENFNYVKARVEVKNTSDQPVKFSPLGLLETNEGEKVSGDQDFYLENLIGEYASAEVREGNLGLVIEETSVENIEWLKIITSDVLNTENNAIHKAKELKIEF
ncbi:hypothetical protein [Bacillus taeanensis]|uniref:DUF4352 domain-containing protein n=1 Tax=Bacillus taeanensis TaxID=273032 RepID=A0A366XQL9_9BACI|nr:hypothetical protein [Bacillus taeanensis]RBW67808.1 hypothetical protein DS031_19880 [Bacillus taeanensis]